MFDKEAFTTMQGEHARRIMSDDSIIAQLVQIPVIESEADNEIQSGLQEGAGGDKTSQLSSTVNDQLANLRRRYGTSSVESDAKVDW